MCGEGGCARPPPAKRKIAEGVAAISRLLYKARFLLDLRTLGFIYFEMIFIFFCLFTFYL